MSKESPNKVANRNSVLRRVGNRLKEEWLDKYYEIKGKTYWQKFRGKRILLHHGVVLDRPTAFNSRFVTQNYLEQQIVFLKHHFHLASVSDLLTRSYPKDKFIVALTFDDGYKNNLEYVLPLLEKYEVPACFFVTSIESEGYDILWADHLDLGYHFTKERITIEGRDYKKSGREFIDMNSGVSLKQHCKEEGTTFKQQMMKVVSDKFKSEDKLYDYWRLMDVNDIKKLNASPFVSIGSHGHFHNNYANISNDLVLDDLQKSRCYLEQITQNPIDLLAFPDGSYSKEVVNMAEETGYKSQFSTGHLYEQDHKDQRLWDRLDVNPYIGLGYQAKAMIDGHY